MSKTSHLRTLAQLALLATFLLMSACATTTPAEPEAVAEPEAPEFEPWDGDGMDIPLDGSSMEAWDSSVARVKHYATPEEYRALEGAVKYLLIYDLESYGDKNKLIQRLDGMTPAEVLTKVKWWQPRVEMRKKMLQQKAEAEAKAAAEAGAAEQESEEPETEPAPQEDGGSSTTP